MKEKLKSTNVLYVIIGVLGVTVAVLFALLTAVTTSNDNNEASTPATMSEAVESNETVVVGGSAGCSGLGACLDVENFLSGVIGTWENSDGSLVTGYTKCDDIEPWSDTDTRILALKFVCDTNDSLVYFDGNEDTYRLPVEVKFSQIKWGEKMELPEYHITESSGGELK